MAPKSARGLLTSVDNLFTTQVERDEAQCEKVITIPTEQITDFPTPKSFFRSMNLTSSNIRLLRNSSMTEE